MAKLSESYKNKIRNEYTSLPDDQKWQYLDELIKQNEYTYREISIIFNRSYNDVVNVFKYLDIRLCSNIACVHKNGRMQTRNNFLINSQSRDGLSKYCKTCIKEQKKRQKLQNRTNNKNGQNVLEYKKCSNPNCLHGNKVQAINNFDQNLSNPSGYDYYCKTCRRKKDKISKDQYKKTDNQKQLNTNYKKCSNINCVHGDELQSLNNFYRQPNYTGYSYLCKDCISGFSLEQSHKYVNYNAYSSRLESYEEIRPNPKDGKTLQVKCALCDQWFNPVRIKVLNRIAAINGKQPGENHFYCSDECKEHCPVYKQHVYRKDDPDHYKNKLDREVQPELRQMKIEQVGYICQRCDRTNFEDISLHCHHIEGIQYEPLESADLDMVMMTCEECHKEIHKIPGCTYQDMKCNL